MSERNRGMLLEVKGLRASVGGKEILKGIDLAVPAGEVHAIMGPNASGKSTLAQVLAGRESFQVSAGSATLDGRDLLSLAPEERARAGLFLAFQYPVEIPGVSNATFLRAAVNAVRKERGQPPLDPVDFLREAKRLVGSLGMDPAFLERPLNAGFSGGEKKRNEVLQMAMLAPRFAILDETDSGLDIDALRVVSQGINSLRSPERGMLVVTHYQRLLDYVVPDRVHVLAGGRIVTSGGPDLAKTLEERGYGWVVPGATGSAAAPAAAGAR